MTLMFLMSQKKEFQALWNKINLKTIYEVQFDSARLISDSREKIDAQLYIGNRVYELKTGELKTGSAEEMAAGSLLMEESREYNKLKNDPYHNTVYDIVGEIENRTHLTRRTIVDILKTIHPQKFVLLRKNPEEFIAKVSKLINEVKASLIINNIVYHKTDAKHDSRTVFANSKEAMRNSELLQKHIYDFLTSDSNIEKEFALALENSTEVLVYAKLPKSFYVPTPVANYSPDWAIVFDKEKHKEVYFVAETKGSISDLDLRGIEYLKMHCAEQHFAEVSNKEVHFKKIATYDELREMLTT